MIIGNLYFERKYQEIRSSSERSSTRSRRCQGSILFFIEISNSKQKLAEQTPVSTPVVEPKVPNAVSSPVVEPKVENVGFYDDRSLLE